MIYPLMTVRHDFPLSQCVKSPMPQGPEEVNHIGRPGNDVNHCDPAWIRWIRWTRWTNCAMKKNGFTMPGGDEQMVPTGVKIWK